MGLDQSYLGIIDIATVAMIDYCVTRYAFVYTYEPGANPPTNVFWSNLMTDAVQQGEYTVLSII